MEEGWIDTLDGLVRARVVGILVDEGFRPPTRWVARNASRQTQKLISAAWRERHLTLTRLPLLGRFRKERIEEGAERRRKLEEHLKQNPDQLNILAADGLPGMASQRDRAARVEGYRVVLAWLLDQIATFKRPVALPGFLNGSECVSVFEARLTAATGAQIQIERPRPLPGGDAEIHACLTANHLAHSGHLHPRARRAA